MCEYHGGASKIYEILFNNFCWILYLFRCPLGEYMHAIVVGLIKQFIIPSLGKQAKSSVFTNIFVVPPKKPKPNRLPSRNHHFWHDSFMIQQYTPSSGRVLLPTYGYQAGGFEPVTFRLKCHDVDHLSTIGHGKLALYKTSDGERSGMLNKSSHELWILSREHCFRFPDKLLSYGCFTWKFFYLKSWPGVKFTW